MRAMHPKPTPEQVCGACAKFEPARNEPPSDPKYGYCKPRERLAEEGHNRNEYRTTGRLVDVTTPCFMVHWNGKTERSAFEAKGGAA